MSAPIKPAALRAPLRHETLGAYVLRVHEERGVEYDHALFMAACAHYVDAGPKDQHLAWIEVARRKNVDELPEPAESFQNYRRRVLDAHGSLYGPASLRAWIDYRKNEAPAMRAARKVLKAFTLRPERRP